MGLIGRMFGALFGNGRNVVVETAGVFSENVEAGAQRQANYAQAALAQFGTEFQIERKGWFDRFIDGLNRLPRPLMVIAVFLLIASAMFDPIWFGIRMQGLALVPDPLWWLAGTIVSFYFGGRFQVKGHEFRQSIRNSAEMVTDVVENISQLRTLNHDSPGVADTGTDTKLSVAAIAPASNSAVKAWKESDK